MSDTPTYSLETHLTHRIEALEAEVRKHRQALKRVSDAVIAGNANLARSLAEAAREMLEAGQ